MASTCPRLPALAVVSLVTEQRPCTREHARATGDAHGATTTDCFRTASSASRAAAWTLTAELTRPNAGTISVVSAVNGACALMHTVSRFRSAYAPSGVRRRPSQATAVSLGLACRISQSSSVATSGLVV